MTNKRQHTSTWQEKKSKFQQKEKSGKRIHLIVACAAVLILAAVGLYTMIGSGTGAGTSAGDFTAGSISGQDLRIPVADVSDGQAKFYNVAVANNQKVRFFAIKSSDGVVRAALDACIICFNSRQGYHQQGDDMVCNKCNRHFRSVDVNVITGGCNPIPLTRSVDGNDLVIKASDLSQGAAYF